MLQLQLTSWARNMITRRKGTTRSRWWKRSIHLVKRRKRVPRGIVKIPWKTSAISLRPALRPQYIQGRSRPIEWFEFVDLRVQQTEGTLSLSIHLLLSLVQPFPYSLSLSLSSLFLLSVTGLVSSLCLASLLSLFIFVARSITLPLTRSFVYTCTVVWSHPLSPTHVYFI